MACSDRSRDRGRVPSVRDFRSRRRHSTSSVLLFTFLTALVAAGSPFTLAQAQGVNLVDLVVQGQTSTDVQLIKNVSGLVPGASITQEDIQQAIHRVYALHLFENVRVLGEEAEGGVHLIIEVTELPRLSGLVFKGNKKLKEKDFGLELRQGQTIDPNRLMEAEQKIRRAYQKKGYFLVDVQSELVPTVVTGESDAVFHIEENSPVKISGVEFVGNASLPSGKLAKKMSNKPRGFIRSLFGGRKFNQEKYADDKRAVTEYYREEGFLDAMIVSDTIVLDEDKSHVTIRIEVNEGARYYFGTTEISGSSVIPEDRLRRLLRYREGDVFDQEEYDESIGQMYEAYMEEGYLYTRVVDDTRTVDTTVDVTLEISEGVPAHVRRIDITGNGKTKDKVIRRELAIFPGQIFRRSALQRSLRNVMLLNYFGNVVPEFRQLPDGRVDLELKVEEKPTGQIQVGGGYSEQDRLVGTINLGIPNLFGNGQSANLLLEFGKRRQSYSLSFTEPWFMNSPTTVGFDIQKLDRVWDDPYVSGTDDFTQQTTGLTLRLGRRLRWPDDYFTVYWNYRWEDQQFTDFSDEYSESDRRDLAASGDGIISSTAFTVLRDSRNLPEFPTAGSRASYRVELGGGVLGGEWTFTKHTLSYAFFHKIWKPFTFAPQWTLGVLQGGSSPSSLPYSELFYAGGIRSDGMIRGYDDRSIVAFADTTQNEPPLWSVPAGEPIDTLRGQAMMVMNAQITFPIVPQQIHGLLFYDAGNVWLNVAEMRPFTDVFTSYGFGFRLTVPGVGMLGFDFGIPLKGAHKGKLKPHFQFGGAF